MRRPHRTIYGCGKGRTRFPRRCTLARDGRIDAVAALVRPWLRTAPIDRHLAVVDALLVARLPAEPLLAGAGCATLDLLVLAGTARACASGGQHRHERHRHDAYPSLHDR